MEYESRTSSDEEDEDDTPPQEVTPAVTGTTRPEKGKEKISPSPGRPQRPKLDTLGLGAAAQLQSSPRIRHSSPSSMSPSSRAWYEFDLAVVVALVSPIGNWLTGGDHIKNILLIVLLIFYLHQITESTSLSSPLPLPTLTDAHPSQSFMGPLPKITPKAPFPLLSAPAFLRRFLGYDLQDVRSIRTPRFRTLPPLPNLPLPLPWRSLVAIRNSQRPWSSIRLMVQHGPLRTGREHEAVVAPRRKDTHAYRGVA